MQPFLAPVFLCEASRQADALWWGMRTCFQPEKAPARRAVDAEHAPGLRPGGNCICALFRLPEQISQDMASQRQQGRRVQLARAFAARNLVRFASAPVGRRRNWPAAERVCAGDLPCSDPGWRLFRLRVWHCGMSSRECCLASLLNVLMMRRIDREGKRAVRDEEEEQRSREKQMIRAVHARDRLTRGRRGAPGGQRSPWLTCVSGQRISLASAHPGSGGRGAARV